MDALDLIMLGRQLTRIGERAVHEGEIADNGPGALGVPLPAGALIVMRDVRAHPGSSISDITARTGLPQSHVSESVNKLRVKGMVEINADPADRRRTLVKLAATHLDQAARYSTREADHFLRIALGDLADDSALQVISMLTELARRLRTEPTAPDARQLDTVRTGAVRS